MLPDNVDRFLKVNDEFCCGYRLMWDTNTITNVTQAHISDLQDARLHAHVTCDLKTDNLVTGADNSTRGVDYDFLLNVTVHDIYNVTFTWQSREGLLREYLGDKHISLPAVVLLTSLYTIIFLSGVLGNVCTCIVIARNRSMHTATNYYLFSLAVSDVLTLLLGE